MTLFDKRNAPNKLSFIHILHYRIVFYLRLNIEVLFLDLNYIPKKMGNNFVLSQRQTWSAKEASFLI